MKGEKRVQIKFILIKYVFNVIFWAIVQLLSSFFLKLYFYERSK